MLPVEAEILIAMVVVLPTAATAMYWLLLKAATLIEIIVKGVTK